MIQYVPITEFTDRMWYDAHMLVYNKDLAYHMGIEPRLIANPPTLVEFYRNILNAVEAGTFYAFGVIKDDEYMGHATLDNKIGEWEIGGVLKDPAMWGSGLGARVVFRAAHWVFEDQERDWLIAFTFGKDPQVKETLLKGGFKPFSTFLIMDKETWFERWSGKVNKWVHRQSQQSD